MKLSQMETQRLAKTLSVIAAPIGRIAEDEELTNALKNLREKVKGMNVIQYYGSMYSAFLPILFEKHAEDTYLIVSELTGKPVNEIKNQPAMKTMKDIKESVDDEFIGFFTSSFSTGQKT